MWHKLKSFYDEYQHILESHYPGLSFERLWREWLEFDHFGHKNNLDIETSPYSKNSHFFCKELLEGVPFAYILGRTYFYNIVLQVNSNVLIPRFETEILVDFSCQWANAQKKEKELVVVDVGTGSGAVLLAFLKAYAKPAKAIGIDISEQALEVAKYNDFLTAFDRPAKEQEITWLLSDRLEQLSPQQKVDLILSNPPYIPLEERDTVHSQVDRFEPHLALFLKEAHYLSWYRLFFQQCYDRLRPGGAVMMEGYPSKMTVLKQLALEIGFSKVQITKDLCDQDRFLMLYTN